MGALRRWRDRALGVSHLSWRIGEVEEQLDTLKLVLGRIEQRQLWRWAPETFEGQQLRVYSQWGEDGIISFLLRHVPVPRRYFVEFGVEDYTEANTRYLLNTARWAGLVIDGNPAHVDRIRRSRETWLADLTAVAAWVTAENINGLLADHGATGPIGLLSIDIDGNDYWVWQAIDVVDPAIVVVEYNHRFGPDQAVTVPYDPGFDRAAAHPSRVYFGASLAALAKLGAAKGYALVGCTDEGVNAFFVRRELIRLPLAELPVAAAFRAGTVREAVDPAGARLTADAEQAILRGLPVVAV